jgi:hypothetical protein
MEIYGSNVELPRLPADAVIERVDVGPVDKRNPLLGVTEVQARFADIEARRPRFIVVPEFWSARYIIEADWVQPTTGECASTAASPSSASLRFSGLKACLPDLGGFD